jgi:hypothetical protein
MVMAGIGRFLLRLEETFQKLEEDNGGIVMFKLPVDSPPVTTEEVRRIETEGA